MISISKLIVDSRNRATQGNQYNQCIGPVSKILFAPIKSLPPTIYRTARAQYFISFYINHSYKFVYKQVFLQLNFIVHTMLITINYRDFPIYNSRDSINVVPEVETPGDFIFTLVLYSTFCITVFVCYRF